MEGCGSYRNYGCDRQKTLTSNLLNIEDQWVSFAVVMVLLHREHQKVKRKFWKLDDWPHVAHES